MCVRERETDREREIACVGVCGCVGVWGVEGGTRGDVRICVLVWVCVCVGEVIREDWCVCMPVGGWVCMHVRMCVKLGGGDSPKGKLEDISNPQTGKAICRVSQKSGLVLV